MMIPHAKRKRNAGKPSIANRSSGATPSSSHPPRSRSDPPQRPVANAGGNNHEKGKTLDGFMMLDCCRAEFPDEIAQAVLSGMNIKDVVTEDLLFFSSLSRLDMSDNEAPFEPFGVLPQLLELDLQCNALEQLVVQSGGFSALEVLNLSFNCLTTQDVEELSKLMRIRELYLCNNCIRSLPPVMDRFSKLETLSLEHNRIAGEEVFTFLAMAPRLRNLNLSHNKIREFPEAALFLDEKRGAGFYSLLYLNLAHNRIRDEDAIIFTSELHSLRKLVLYGNPLSQAAVMSHDPTKLNYDPVPTLNARFTEEARDVFVVVAYPETKKKRSTLGTYENVEIYRMLPNEVPLPSPFHSRTAVEDREPKKQEKPRASEPNNPGPRAKSFAVDNSDSTFLTGVGIEDILPDHSSRDSLSQLPTMPASVITRSLAVNRQTNPLKARAAINALRYQLEHPLTSHNDADILPASSQRPTQAHLNRQMPRHSIESTRLPANAIGPPSIKPFSSTPAPHRSLTGSLGVDDALTRLSYQVARSWDKRLSGQTQDPHDVDRAMDSLISTAQKVSIAYSSTSP